MDGAVSQHHPYRDLSKFPHDLAAAGSTWWRITASEHAGEPLWFNNSGECRFDLNQHSGRGTCYLSEELMGALVETVWRDATPTGDPNRNPPIAASELDGRRAVRVELQAKRRVADVTHGAGHGLHGGFGITSAIGTCDNYQRPQEWAGAWDSEGLEGVLYELAHGNGIHGLALFGPAGAQTGTCTVHELTETFLAAEGVTVLTDPDLDALTVIDDPDDATAHIAP